jgi:hypothetical protein
MEIMCLSIRLFVIQHQSLRRWADFFQAITGDFH